jgi:hypothetical protein
MQLKVESVHASSEDFLSAMLDLMNLPAEFPPTLIHSPMDTCDESPVTIDSIDHVTSAYAAIPGISSRLDDLFDAPEGATQLLAGCARADASALAVLVQSMTHNILPCIVISNSISHRATHIHGVLILFTSHFSFSDGLVFSDSHPRSNAFLPTTVPANYGCQN